MRKICNCHTVAADDFDKQGNVQNSNNLSKGAKRMLNNSRAAIACIVTGIRKGQISPIYDHHRSKHIIFSGSVSGSSISIYDHDRGCHIAGSTTSVYDYGIEGHIQIAINENSFNGYDYHTGNHFKGTINGDNLSIYDYQTSTHYNYST